MSRSEGPWEWVVIGVCISPKKFCSIFMGEISYCWLGEAKWSSREATIEFEKFELREEINGCLFFTYPRELLLLNQFIPVKSTF